ncbi:beta-1,4-galactosyltransferase 3 isoform X2 [Pongo abelii]|uniref:beta-1,4-galactosyltransferase 3 isoform X2 n=1 Tax=Pongo abelii TaxID=9601 RepID=UPI00300546EE
MLKLLTLTWMEVNNTAFNQGRLCNVGFWEAIQEEDWDCVFFHDVNLLPDDCNLYTCDFIPAHVSVAINKFNYKLPHPGHLGGVFAVHPTHYLKINGFSNVYWGWDDEDDITARWGAGAAGPDMMRQTLPYAGGGRPWPQAEALEASPSVPDPPTLRSLDPPMMASTLWATGCSPKSGCPSTPTSLWT